MCVKKIIFSLFLILLFTGCSSKLIEIRALSKISDNFKPENTPTAEEYNNNDAVVLLKERTYDIDYVRGVGLETYITYHKIIKVYKNMDQYAEVQIGMGDDDTFESFSARTIKPDGTVVNLSEDDIYIVDMQKHAKNYKGKGKGITFRFPSIEKNSVLELKYTLIAKGPYLDVRWYLEEKNPIKINRFTMKLPKWIIDEKDLGWNWNYQTYNYKNMPEPSVSNDLGGGDRSFSWELKNLKSFHHEAMMPHSSRFRPFVDFNVSSWDSWSQAGKWYYTKKLKPALKLTKKLKKLAKKLTAGKKSEIDKVNAIYEYANKLHYSNTHDFFGHGILPVSADRVVDRGYGDCKDKSILIVALLKAVDITAFPVLVNTMRNIDEKMPSLGVFDHMIAQIRLKDKRIIWADPTFTYSPLGYIPPQNEGKNVLVIKSTIGVKSHLTEIPETPYHENIISEHADVTIISPEKSEVNVTITYQGSFATWEKNYVKQLNTRRLKKYCKNFLSEDFFNISVRNIQTKHTEEFVNKFQISFSFTTDLMIESIASDQYALNTLIFGAEHNGRLHFLQKDKRKFPLKWNYSYIHDINVDINYPSNLFSVSSIPAEQTLSFGDKTISYSRKIEKNSNKLQISSKYFRKHREIPATKYDQLRTFFSNLKKSVKEKIIISGSKLAEIKKAGISKDS